MKSKVIAALVAMGMMASIVSATVVSKNGIAKDSVTGLEWQDNEPYTDAEMKAYFKDTNNGKVGNWEYSTQYCENLSLGGKNDWRLPNIYELTMLLDNTKSSYSIDSGLSINSGFQNIYTGYYWSSTTNTSVTSGSWAVNFDGSSDIFDSKSGSGYVRCVRGKQLNFNHLDIFKKSGKVKVSQENIDKISPVVQAKKKKEAEIAAKEKAKKEAKEQAERDRQTRQNNSTTPSSNSYVSWKVKSKFDNPKSYDPEHSATIYNISCSNGKSDVVSYFYNKQQGIQYFTAGRAGMATLDEAANSICVN